MATKKADLAVKKYRDLISATEQEKQNDELDYVVQEGKLQLEADINETKKALSQAKRTLATQKAAVPFETTAVLKTMATIDGLEQNLARAEALLVELF